MKITRIFAVFLRHWYAAISNPERWLEIFYWPLFDLLLWGITGFAIQNRVGEANQVGFIIILGMLLWLILQRMQHEVSMCFLTDMWDSNLVNLFISPLSFQEWFFAVTVVGFIKMMLSFLFAISVAFVMYQLNLFALGITLVPIFGLLLLFGWAIGAMVVSVLFLFGSKAQTFSWIIITFIAPFSAIYYSVSALPNWAQFLGKLLPASYAFEAARKLLTTNILDYQILWRGYVLALLYVLFSLFMLRQSIYLSLQRGLFKNK
jgi:ABC-2 type transport system permease protein